ncbi:MAG: 7-cyano-7-deazaguanine synthase QueC [Spirochaetia bacterium]|nr:7-cyano-7-deazaguanine synthase QueC [Spirochaetia bacterium]
MKNNTNKAVVLLSGGLDSAVCLYEAKNLGYQIITLTFNYGQKHDIELQYAKNLAKNISAIESIVFNLNLSLIGKSSLTDNIEIPKHRENIHEKNNIPNTYVPGRNIIFLSMAAALAESRDCQNIFIGVNQMDYSGYPDCRIDFIKSFQEMLALGTKSGIEEKPITIHTPLIYLTKSEIIKKAASLNVPVQQTWSCYDPQKTNDGTFLPCLSCDSCILREKGFKEAEIS